MTTQQRNLHSWLIIPMLLCRVPYRAGHVCTPVLRRWIFKSSKVADCHPSQLYGRVLDSSAADGGAANLRGTLFDQRE